MGESWGEIDEGFPPPSMRGCRVVASERDVMTLSKEGILRWITVLSSVSALTLAVLAGMAGAASADTTTIGQTGDPQIYWTGGDEIVSPNSVIPAGGGTVTSLQTQSVVAHCPAGTGTFDLQVLRPNGYNTFLVIGDTGNQTDPCDGQMHSYPVNIPVHAGDVLGAYAVTNWLGVLRPGSGYDCCSFQPEPAVGQTVTAYGLFQGYGVDESATLERSDTTPPTLTLSHTPDGQNGWNVSSPVTETISASDSGSGLAGAPSCTVDGNAATLSAGGSAGTWTLGASSDGQHSVSCSVSDNAGNQAQASDTVKIDTTPPVVSYTGNAGTYSVADSVSITCSASDPSPGSGVANSTCQDISGSAYTFALGTNSYSASATDNAGNVGNGSAAFTVTVDPNSLSTLTQRWVTDPNTASALCAKLAAAQASVARGDTNSAENQLGAYRNQLSAQSGKNIPADKAQILSQLSQTI